MRCSVHQGDIPGAVGLILVGVIEQCSGPGIPVWACQPCVTKHGIVPFEDDPVYTPRPTGIQRAA
jgi:hypothetical protein